MVCHHEKGDPRCSTYKYAPEIPTAITPDSEKFELEDVYQHGSYIVLKVRYPNCIKCSFEGMKILVYRDVNVMHILKWRKIDPHFRKDSSINPKEAPSPIARFPANAWEEARKYVHFLQPGSGNKRSSDP